jgi:hypothetical protein
LARRLWGWHLYLLVCLAATVFPSFYLFLVRNLGFHLSRTVMLGAALLPCSVLIGHAVDDAFAVGADRRDRVLSILFMAPTAAFTIAVVMVGLLSREAPGSFINVRWTLVGLAAVGILAVSVLRRSKSLLLLCVVASTVLYCSQMTLSRPRSAYLLTSSLTQTLASHLTEGERFAFVAEKKPRVLPPNSHVPAHLASVHTYNSLSSQRYQALVRKLGGATVRYGRHQRFLGPEIIDSPLLDLTGIGVLISEEPLESDRIEYAQATHGLWIHRISGPPRQFALTTLGRQEYERFESERDIGIDHDRLDRGRIPVTRTSSFDDREVYETATGDSPALLFISREYHPKWSAQSAGRDGSQRLSPKLIDGFFLGFVLPPGTERIEVRFRPYVFWSFVPQMLFAGAFLLLAGRFIFRRLRLQASRV